MEILKAKNAGFCFGVKRAIDEVNKVLLDKGGKVYSIGPIIHNEIVTKNLAKKGLVVIDDVEAIKKLKNEVVIIRTHGIEKELQDILQKNKNYIVDLTCPFVKRIHHLVEEYSNNGYNVLIIGDENHPEVRGIMSYAKGAVAVINDEKGIKLLKFDKKAPLLILFQTTMNVSLGQKLVDILKELFYNYKIEKTICDSTENRQQEVKELAKVCDVMLIIGSTSSSNCKKLYDVAKSFCKNSYLLNSKEDLLNINIKDVTKVGVSAGASTPEYLIEEILTNARNEF